MSGPFLPSREAQPFDLLENIANKGGGWDGLEEIFRPQLQDVPLQPRDEVALFIYGMSQAPQSKEVLEWLMDITLRLPFRATGETFEQTALRTATRQGINGVGEAVLAAIAHGRKLVEQRKTQNGAGT